MSKDINFSNSLGVDFFPPKPAIKNIPQWYLDTPEYLNGVREHIEGQQTPHTIKKCIPVFDAMTSGYILYTQVEVEVLQKEGHAYFQWPSQEAISFHPIEQAHLHPQQNGSQYPKWINPYVIKTPPGYSSLFLPPMHNANGIFTIFPGIVDTDKYYSPTNFPFTLNDPKWTGIIPPGTPIAQVIPFKRDSWKMSTTDMEIVEESRIIFAKLKTLLYNGYKKQFWTRKEFK